MLNDDQLEVAARIWCELAGLDPDEEVMHGADPDANGVVLAIALYSPRWKRVAQEIHHIDMVAEAIKAGGEE